MDSMRLFQQKALRQLFQSRAAFPRQTLRQISHSTAHQPPFFRTRPPKSLLPSSRPITTYSRLSRANNNRFSHVFKPFRRGQSTTTTTQSAKPPEKLSLSQRMRKLSREYGWSAVGVYLLLSALDFPFCFLAVRYLGTDRIGHWEHVIISHFKLSADWVLNGLGLDGKSTVGEKVDEAMGEVRAIVTDKIPAEMVGPDGQKRILEEKETFAIEQEAGRKRLLEEGQVYHVQDHGVKEAEAANRREDASIWTQLALAYAIHKSFIFIRVPFTAAITPKVVHTLRGWGWNIGTRSSKQVASKA